MVEEGEEKHEEAEEERNLKEEGIQRNGMDYTRVSGKGERKTEEETITRKRSGERKKPGV